MGAVRTGSQADTETRMTTAERERNRRKLECQARGRNRTRSGNSLSLPNITMTTSCIKYAAQNDLQALKMFHQLGADLSAQDYDGRTPLHLAVQENNLEIVKFLLETCRVDLRPDDRWKNTPRSMVSEDNEEMSDYLDDYERRLDQGELPELPTEESSSMDCDGGVMCTLASKGDLQTIKEYIEQGHDPTKADYDGRTALHLACSEGHIKIVKFLLDVRPYNFRPVDRFGHTPLGDAQRYRHDEIVRILNIHMRQIAINHATVYTPNRHHVKLAKEFIKCIEEGNRERCAAILSEATKAGLREKIVNAIEYQPPNGNLSQPNAEGNSKEIPLLKIVYAPKYNLDIMSEVLKHTLRIGPELKCEVLEHCIALKRPELLQLVLEKTTADPCITGRGWGRPLYASIEHCCEFSAKLLLQYGADPNLPHDEYDKYSPINFCIRNSNNTAAQCIPILDVLIKGGGDPNTAGFHGVLPVQHAIETQRPVDETVKLISFLAKKAPIKANLNGHDPHGQTLLHYASGNASHRPLGYTMPEKDRLTLVKSLVTFGVDINYQGKDGNTALHTAANSDHAQIVQYLLEKGADKTLRNVSNYSAADIAPLNSKSRQILHDSVKKCSSEDDSESVSTTASERQQKKKKRQRPRRRRRPKATPVEQSEEGAYNIALGEPVDYQNAERKTREATEHYESLLSASINNLNVQTDPHFLDDPSPERILYTQERTKYLNDGCIFVSQRLGKKYKPLLRHLNREHSPTRVEAILDNLESRENDLAERAIQGLRSWREWRGRLASLRCLHRALCECGLTQLAIEFQEKFCTG